MITASNWHSNMGMAAEDVPADRKEDRPKTRMAGNAIKRTSQQQSIRVDSPSFSPLACLKTEHDRQCWQSRNSNSSPNRERTQ